MKTLRVALFFIFGAIFTLHSFAQEVKTEKKAKIRMEIIDDDGNKKVIDTTFTVHSDHDYTEIMRQIKEDAGFSKKEIAKMKAELKAHAKDVAIDVEVMIEHFDKEKIHEHMMIVREEMNKGKEELQKALKELKIELKSMKMNEKAMQKLEKAMEELHHVEWAEHAKQFKLEMKELHEHIGEEVNVFIMDGKKIKKNVWIDDDEKHILVNVSVDGDSVTVSKMHNVVFIGEHMDKDQNIWIEKDGEKIVIKKVSVGGNMVFFGDDADLEKIHEIDGEHRVIIKKLKGEAAKGEAIFISDDAHMVKEFKDKDGNVKVMHFKMKSGNKEEKEMKFFTVGAKHGRKEVKKKMLMISSHLSEVELAKAVEKGVYDENSPKLKLKDFTLNVNDEVTTIGTTFEDKGRLKVKLFDAEMNQIWEDSFGRVSGEWSTELPSNLLKETGKYFILFNHGKKVKLILLGLK